MTDRDVEYADTLAGDDDDIEGIEGDDEEILAGLMGEELGRRRRTQLRRAVRPPPRRAPRQASMVQSMPTAQLIPQVTGVPRRGLRKTWLPLGAVAFTATSGTSLVLTAQTQRPFRGTRMIFDAARTGATAVGLLTLNETKCGQDAQPAAAGPAPLGAFFAQAFDADIDLDPIGPGVSFIATVNISAAPTLTDRVDVSGVLFGYQLK